MIQIINWWIMITWNTFFLNDKLIIKIINIVVKWMNMKIDISSCLFTV